MFSIKSNTVNGLSLEAFKLLSKSGDKTTSDKGTVIETRRVTSEMTDPTQRYLYLKGRHNSIYAAIAETLWVMSGTDIIDGWLTRFLHRAPLYSDDGHTWYRAYGKMLYQNNQFAGVLKYLQDSIQSRQAVLSIYDPAAESYDSVVNALGHPNAKDKSCNNLMYFSTDSSRTKLDLHICNRSNDVLFGAYSINLFEFTFIQEIVASILSLELGIYSVYHNNLHVYMDTQATGKQFYDVLEADQTENCYHIPSHVKMDLGNVLSYSGSAESKLDMDKTTIKLRALFKDIIFALESGEGNVYFCLDNYGIGKNTKLYHYSSLLDSYMYNTPLDITNMDGALKQAVISSKFTKFQLAY